MPHSFFKNRRITVNDPAIARKLFSEVWPFSFVWLGLRIYLGWLWLDAGWMKIIGNGAHPWGPESLLKFWNNAVVIPNSPARPAIVYDWYRVFLQFLIDIRAEAWFAPLVAWGELIVGVALILGVFTGISAVLGAFMNMNFMLAGVASINPVMLALSFFLMLGWKIAGWWGFDRWILPKLGAPWSRVEVVIDGG